LHLAEEFHSDVVISKPAFVHLDGTAAPPIRWPIDDLIETQKITAPRLLDLLEVLTFTATNLDGTLLGSSASNLYRTETLKKFPFPVQFGKAGDGAWAIAHFADVKWAITPRRISTFLIHADAASAWEILAWQSSARLDRVLCQALASLPGGPSDRMEKLLQASGHWLDAKAEFDRMRRQPFPWFLRLNAWRARHRRDLARRACVQERQQILSLLAK
jgi:hypothetical protein